MSTYVDVWTTPERKALRDSVTAFVKSEMVPNLPEWEKSGEIPREVQKKLAHAGLLSVGFPEEQGGDGGDFIDATIVCEAWLEAGGSGGTQASIFTHLISIPHIAENGSQYLIDRYVKPTAQGELIGSLGVTEPGAGSDVANISTKAVRDGDHYVINGAKTFITSSVRGDFVTTLVRTGDAGSGGLSLIVVDKDTPGFAVSRKLDKHGWLSSDTGELSYQDVRVPVENLVGEENQGFYYVAQQFITERLGLASLAYSTAQRALDLTAEYAKVRETFGKPLTEHQVIRHKLVEMHRVTQDARIVTRNLIERAIGAEKTDLDLIRDAALAKNTAIKAVEYVTNEAVQIHGGMGYMRESEVEMHYRDMRILGIGGGATEVMNELAGKLLGF
jgi:acyl-CoA dehydrogenase